MDTLIEQIYRHKNTAAENLKKYGILVVVLAAATAVMVSVRLLAGNAFAYMLGGIACLVIIYLGAFHCASTRVIVASWPMALRVFCASSA